MARVCSVDGCNRVHRSKGYCSLHYSRVRATGSPGSVNLLRRSTRGLCDAPECAQPIRCKGLCSAHYSRLITRGTIERWEPAQGCGVSGCQRTHYAKKLCALHYRRLLTTGTTDDPAPRKKSRCSVIGCERVAIARELCNMHYSRWKIHGSTDLPERTSKATPAIERFLSSFSEGASDECWEWQGTRTHNGYGVIGEMAGGKLYQRKAHRLSYEHYVGEIPPGMGIDHQCRNTSCVNPNHLIPATPKTNGENRVANKGSLSKYRGVTFRKAARKWVAYVGHDGERIHLGTFDSEDDAGRAAIEARNELYTNNVPDRPRAINPFVHIQADLHARQSIRGRTR